MLQYSEPFGKKLFGRLYNIPYIIVPLLFNRSSPCTPLIASRFSFDYVVLCKSSRLFLRGYSIQEKQNLSHAKYLC